MPTWKASPAGIDCWWRLPECMHQSSLAPLNPASVQLSLLVNVSRSPRLQCARMMRAKLFPSARAAARGKQRGKEAATSVSIDNANTAFYPKPVAKVVRGTKYRQSCSYRPHRFNSFSRCDAVRSVSPLRKALIFCPPLACQLRWYSRQDAASLAAT